MKRSIFTLFTILTQWSSAQNLVPNPSFENSDNTFCGIMVPGDYSLTAIDWYSPTYGTPDLYFTNIAQTCFNFQPNSTYSGPIGIKGSQMPRTGNRFTGFFAYTISGMEQREYIQVPLTSALLAGQKYIVECYVSLADSTEFATNQVGMHLSVQPITLANDGVLNYTPQVISNGYISDTQNWILISDTITATDSYAYLTIGNFSTDVQTPTIANPSASGNVGTYGAYYFIDDIRVEMYSDTTHPEVGILELSATEKTLIKIVDFMGRETAFTPNTALIYIYSDGTRERVMKMEE